MREIQWLLNNYKINIIKMLMNYFLYMSLELKKLKLKKTIRLFVSLTMLKIF